MNKKKKAKEPEFVELEEENIILKIPKNTIGLTVEALILDENEATQKVHKKLGLSDVRECRQKFLDNLIDDDYDCTYVLTDKGRECLEQLSKGKSMEDLDSET